MKRINSWERQSSHLRMSAVLILGGGIAINSILSLWLQSVENREEERIFLSKSHQLLYAFDNSLQHVIGLIDDLNRAFSTGLLVREDQFRAITDPVLERHSYVHAIAFRRFGSNADTRSATARQRGIMSFDAGASLHALDAAALRSQQQAIALSRKRGEPVATRLFHLSPSGDADSPPYFSIVAASYEQEPDASSRISGYTLAVLDARHLAKDILLRENLAALGNADIALFENNGDRNQLILHQTGARAMADQGSDILPSDDEEGASDVLHVTRLYDVAGSRWKMTISTERHPITISNVLPWTVLIGGSLISLLLAAWLQSLANRAKTLANAARTRESDFASLQAMERELLAAQKEMRALVSHRDRAVEDERKRIAREIHDDLGQNLLALRIDVTLLEQQTAPAHPDINPKVQALLRQIDVTVKSVRAIVNHLRPAALDAGLCAAVEWLVMQLGQRSKVKFSVAVESEEFCLTLDEQRATAVFRVVQEALSNVVRHANARHAEVRLEQREDWLRVQIIDDGIGTYPGDQRKPRSFGLIGIRERVRALGGTFSMRSEPNQGTSITFAVPARQTTNESCSEAVTADSDAFAV
jgi:signal transduction histidine kinase